MSVTIGAPVRRELAGPQEFDPDVLKDPTRSLLIGYLGGNADLFRCPADLRQGKYQGSDPAFIGQIVPAARTFSMSQAVGTIDPGYNATEYDSPPYSHYGTPNLSVNGPWLNNQHTHHRDSPWATYGKATDVRNPSPSMLWVLVDEDARGLNDAAFAFGMETPEWFDAPGVYHNGGCGFAFADGHSETHRWLSGSPKASGGVIITDASDQQDWSLDATTDVGAAVARQTRAKALHDFRMFRVFRGFKLHFPFAQSAAWRFNVRT